MATRVKKQATATKEVASPQASATQKNDAAANSSPKTAGKPPNPPGIAKRLGKKAPTKTIVKKTVQIKKAKKPKKNALKINPRNLARVLMENGKGLEAKKLLLKNGVKESVKRGRKPKTIKVKQEPVEEEPPPVLEPIFPQEENVEVKKTPKKRGRKPLQKIPELIDIKKIKTEVKTEPVDYSEETVEESDISLASVPTTPTPKRRPGRQRKIKPETSSIEEVMNDLSFLIGTEQIKKEHLDPAVEPTKTEPVKIKRYTKKQRLDLIKQDLTKKENIENTLRKLDSGDNKCIDRLDLNVRKIKADSPTVKRRHSIEKFPIGSVDSSSDGLMSQLAVFNQLPRSISPRTSKRAMKFGGRRSSPYSTRSDSPARLLRNGKHRRLRDSLLEGLEDPKRRKRMHSDLSGSESASKMSGYDSDSSFSDMASLHGSEKDSELSKPANKDADNLLLDESSNMESKDCTTPDLIKGTNTAELDKQLIDTNSNVCGELPNNSDADLSANTAKKEETQTITIEDSPSAKVPEKGLILDIMKQAFNSTEEENNVVNPPVCGAARFYGTGATETEEQTILKKEIESTSVEQKNENASKATPEDSSQTMSEERELMKVLEQTALNIVAIKKGGKENDGLVDFPLEEEETGEQATFENIVQGCIDSIGNISPELPQLPPEAIVEALGDVAPVLEKQVATASDDDKDDSLPIIDNMSTADLDHPNSESFEHLDPPHLESSVPGPEPDLLLGTDEDPKINDRNLGIAVTEKDNVVSFSIEHISDEEHENSNEETNQSVEEGNKSIQGDEEELETGRVAEEVELDKTNQDPIADKEMDTELVEPVISPTNEKIDSETNQIPTDEANLQQTTEIDCDKPSENTILKELNTEGESKAIEDDEEENSKTEHEDDSETTMGVTQKNLSDNVSTEDVVDKTVDDEKIVSEDKVEESPEELAQKESILKALGLQSLRAIKETKPIQKKGKPSTSKAENYTGTLKTVIKINKKKGKNSFKMTLQKNKSKHDGEPAGGEEGYKVLKEVGSSTWKPSKESSDTAGAHRKSHYSNRSNMEGSSEHTSDGEQAGPSQDKNQPEKSLIVPEKASSFSIHPGRLCKDECSYCFGKFGLFDTPCHIAQMKSVDRQNKILASEKHLTRDSCLCDACYRHVDRKSNSPSYINKSLKRNSLVAPGPRQNHCHVLGCNNVSSNILRRKWIIKMRKSICQVINIDLDNPGLHSIPICDEHFTALEHLMICAMCRRRLARNHIHYLGPEVMELNEALKDEGIPLNLSDKPVVCKLCRCFASIILKDPEERAENSVNFFKEYKKRLLHFNDIVPMDSAAAEEPIVVPNKSDKPSEKKDLDPTKKRKRIRNSSNETVHSGKDGHDERSENSEDIEDRSRTRVPSTDTNNSHSANQSRSQSPDDGDEYGGVDYNTLIPAIAMDCPSDGESKKEYSRKIVGLQKKIPRLESVGNAIEISRTFGTKMDRNRSNDLAAQKLGQNPSISLKPSYGMEGDPWESKQSSRLMSNPSISVRQLFPGEEEMGLMGDIDFKNVVARTPEGWEKCVATIQYDQETRMLWQELQKPYGSKSSFLRHLVLLEKYFRNGDLILSPTATHHAINYRESVHNRLRAYDNIPSSAGNIQPISMIPFNKMNNRSTSGIVTGVGHPGSNPSVPPVTISQVGRDSESNVQSSKAPITLQQLSQPPLLPSSSMLQNLAASKQKSSGMPPGLISINPAAAAARSTAHSLIRPQMPSQKIKFPITKNWRPNLIPIDPTKKNERKPGLVQVISGGKPYHITLEDYKKMCAIKRSFEAKQKKIQEQLIARQQQLLQGHQPQQSVLVSHNSVLKSVIPKKGLIISKTSGGTLIESKSSGLLSAGGASATITSANSGDSSETILEKLDKQVEMLGQNPSLPAITFDKNSSVQIIPRIPKSLTVIPQTVRKTGPPSPILYITPKSSTSGAAAGANHNSDKSNQS